MFTDLDIILATAEAVPHGGVIPGGLGGNTISGVAGTPYYIDMSRADNPLGQGIDQLAVSKLELNVTITTAFTVGPDSYAEFQLVSLPINPTLLTAATTSGRLTHLAAAVTTASDDSVTIAGHGLPVGTPVYLSALATTTGIAVDTIYYVVPISASKFGLASTLALALAGTVLTLTNNGTCTVEFFPMVHVTTGQVWSEFLKLGAQFVGRSIPGAVNGAGNLRATYAGETLQPVGASAQPSTSLGGGAGTAVVAAPGKFLVPRVLLSGGTNIDTTGRYSLALCCDAGQGQRHFPVGSEIKSGG